MYKATRSVCILFLALPGLLFIAGCSTQDNVSLRRFPYPYQAALAISSDIDETGSVEELIAIHKFLSSDGETDLGPGLGLDFGNSFWFYNDYVESRSQTESDSAVNRTYIGETDDGISVFVGSSDSLSESSPALLALIRAGAIDCLHSYGHFGQSGFSRSLAEQALSLLSRESLAVDVYINHGGKANRQNMGDASWFLGDNPVTDCYHSDLTVAAGIKFLWRGQLTHCIGQDGDFSVLNLLKRTYEYFQDAVYGEQGFSHDNQLVHPYRLDDGAMVFDFVRYINPWGRYSVATEEFLASQLGPGQVDELIENRGYMVFYTHLGRNQGHPYLSSSTVNALRYIKARYDSGDLLVTTTSRLLNYYVRQKYLFWRTWAGSDTVFISVDSIVNEVQGRLIPDAGDLPGLTFYVPGDKTILVRVAGQLVPATRNAEDATGRVSISIPWQRLNLPDDIYQLGSEPDRPMNGITRGEQ